MMSENELAHSFAPRSHVHSLSSFSHKRFHFSSVSNLKIQFIRNMRLVNGKIVRARFVYRRTFHSPVISNEIERRFRPRHRITVSWSLNEQIAYEMIAYEMRVRKERKTKKKNTTTHTQSFNFRYSFVPKICVCVFFRVQWLSQSVTLAYGKYSMYLQWSCL